MSMIGYFLAITADKLDELVEDPNLIPDFLDQENLLEGDFLDVDKAWHGIHFMLTGSAWEGEPPLRWVVMAPTELGEDVGYGPARVLTPGQVVQVSNALASITGEQLRAKYDGRELNQNEIYPGWDDIDPGYIIDYFEDLKKLYASAAERGLAMVQWLS